MCRKNDYCGCKSNRYVLCDESLKEIFEMLDDLFYQRDWSDGQVAQDFARGGPEARLGYGLDRGDLITLVRVLMDRIKVQKDALAMLEGYFLADLAHYNSNPADPAHKILTEIQTALEGKPGLDAVTLGLE